MDLLEYQGKQLFKKHGVPVPDGRHAASVDEAVKAADDDAKLATLAGEVKGFLKDYPAPGIAI